jgi:hypothetical protein
VRNRKRVAEPIRIDEYRSVPTDRRSAALKFIDREVYACSVKRSKCILHAVVTD